MSMKLQFHIKSYLLLPWLLVFNDAFPSAWIIPHRRIRCKRNLKLCNWIFHKCVVSGFRSGVNEECALLRFTRRRMVIPYRRFGTNSSKTAWPLKMGPIGWPKTSIRNYHPPFVNPQKRANLILIPYHAVCLQYEKRNEKLIRIAEIWVSEFW